MPTPLQTAIGFVTAFFDTLGIGSFATTTAVYKLRNMVPVKLIPGTLNVGHVLLDDRAGVHLHAARAGRADDAGADDRGGGGRRVARRRRRGALAAAQDSDRHGRRAARRGGADADDARSTCFPPAATTQGLTGVKLGIGLGRQLRARRADDARHRPLRAVHDPGLPARHEPDRGVSDHDGIVRVPDAGQQRPVRQDAAPTTCRRRSAWRSAACRRR